MAMDKTIRRVTNTAQQDAENFRYWQSLSVGDRLTAVLDLNRCPYYDFSLIPGFASRMASTSARSRILPDLSLF